MCDGVDANNLGYFMWSISDNRLVMDALTAEWHGFSVATGAIGVSIEQILERVDSAQRDEMAGAIMNSLTTGVPFDFRYKLCLPDGKVRHIAARARPIFDAENVPFLGLGAVQDVTPKRPPLRIV